MKAFGIALLGLICVVYNLQACVTVDPNNGTYTVDNKGCVE
jgi:hypothetical protein